MRIGRATLHGVACGCTPGPRGRSDRPSERRVRCHCNAFITYQLISQLNLEVLLVECEVIQYIGKFVDNLYALRTQGVDSRAEYEGQFEHLLLPHEGKDKLF